jgi:hypothetical protein
MRCAFPPYRSPGSPLNTGHVANAKPDPDTARESGAWRDALRYSPLNTGHGANVKPDPDAARESGAWRDALRYCPLNTGHGANVKPDPDAARESGVGRESEAHPAMSRRQRMAGCATLSRPTDLWASAENRIHSRFIVSPGCA